jgi:hypothetical protein
MASIRARVAARHNPGEDDIADKRLKRNREADNVAIPMSRERDRKAAGQQSARRCGEVGQFERVVAQVHQRFRHSAKSPVQPALGVGDRDAAIAVVFVITGILHEIADRRHGLAPISLRFPSVPLDVRHAMPSLQFGGKEPDAPVAISHEPDKLAIHSLKTAIGQKE